MIEFTQKNIIDVCLGTKTIQAGYFGTTLVYQKSAPGPSTDPYITFTANAPSTIGLSKKSSVHTLEYSTNKTSWSTLDTNPSINLSAGDKVYVRGVLSAAQNNGDYTRFSITGNVNISGNINSIWNYQDLTASLKQYCGYRMFYGCTGLTTVGSLPATTLASGCYEYMFDGCSSLTSAPELPATTLASGCYENMFRNCTSLTTAPALPATTLSSLCYAYMFYGCTALTAAPELPATTLRNTYPNSDTGCYQYMFYGCTALTAAPELPATTLSGDCYSHMFQGCTALQVAPELNSTSAQFGSYKYMFQGCTSLTTAPIINCSTINSDIAESMFSGCSSLRYVKCLSAYNTDRDGVKNWMYGTNSSGTFVKNANALFTWRRDANGIPSGWTVQNA